MNIHQHHHQQNEHERLINALLALQVPLKALILFGACIVIANLIAHAWLR
jgi:hypothetical protein